MGLAATNLQGDPLVWDSSSRVSPSHYQTSTRWALTPVNATPDVHVNETLYSSADRAPATKVQRPAEMAGRRCICCAPREPPVLAACALEVCPSLQRPGACFAGAIVSRCSRRREQLNHTSHFFTSLPFRPLPLSLLITSGLPCHLQSALSASSTVCWSSNGGSCAPDIASPFCAASRR